MKPAILEKLAEREAELMCLDAQGVYVPAHYVRHPNGSGLVLVPKTQPVAKIEPAPTPQKTAAQEIEQPQTAILPVLADAGLALDGLIGAACWFAVCVPVGILAHIGKAITSKPNAPNAALSDLPPIPQPRRRSITVEREWREKIQIKDV